MGKRYPPDLFPRHHPRPEKKKNVEIRGHKCAQEGQTCRHPQKGGGNPKVNAWHRLRPRTTWHRQKEQDDLAREKIRINEDRLEKRLTKQEHQRQEGVESQEKASGAGSSQSNISPVQQFRGINEENLQEADTQGTPENVEDPEGSASPNVSETDESIEVEVFFPKNEGKHEPRPRDTESEEEQLRDDENEYELDPEFQSTEDEETESCDESPPPEREITFTPAKPTKNARRNAKRRKQQKLQRRQDEYEENKKKIHIKRRLYSSRKNPFLRIGPQPQTSSTEILSDSEARANPRSEKEKDKSKRRRESQESIEELDAQGRKVPKNKYRRH